MTDTPTKGDCYKLLRRTRAKLGLAIYGLERHGRARILVTPGGGDGAYRDATDDDRRRAVMRAWTAANDAAAAAVAARHEVERWALAHGLPLGALLAERIDGD